jgi:hypothetical protein
MTNVIRSDDQTSRRAKVKSTAVIGSAVFNEWKPDHYKGDTVFMWRLTTGRWEVGVRGLGISAVTAPVQIGTAEDRDVIVPMKPVKADGGKGARKEAENAGSRRKTRAVVPMRPKPNERENRTARSMPHMRARSPVSNPTARWDTKDDSALETLKQTAHPHRGFRPESRMREIRPYGSEGGAARKGCPYPYPGAAGM